jgi:hypothetical protein
MYRANTSIQRSENYHLWDSKKTEKHKLFPGGICIDFGNKAQILVGHGARAPAVTHVLGQFMSTRQGAFRGCL